VPKNLRLVSIHDVLTSREARSDPTGSRARIKGERAPEAAPKTLLHGWTLSGTPATEAKTPLYAWALSDPVRAPRLRRRR